MISGIENSNSDGARLDIGDWLDRTDLGPTMDYPLMWPKIYFYTSHFARSSIDQVWTPFVFLRWLREEEGEEEEDILVKCHLDRWRPTSIIPDQCHGFIPKSAPHGSFDISFFSQPSIQKGSLLHGPLRMRKLQYPSLASLDNPSTKLSSVRKQHHGANVIQTIYSVPASSKDYIAKLPEDLHKFYLASL